MSAAYGKRQTMPYGPECDSLSATRFRRKDAENTGKGKRSDTKKAIRNLPSETRGVMSDGTRNGEGAKNVREKARFGKRNRVRGTPGAARRQDPCGGDEGKGPR